VTKFSSGFSRGVIWFNRLLLLAATFIMTMIALRTLRDPIGSTLPMGIVLSSPAAITVVRVGFGGFPLGFAVALVGCLVSTRRLLGGLLLLASIMAAATITRLQGIVLDGATPYNVALLAPEIAFCVLSAVGIVLERRRRREEHDGSSSDHRAAPGKRAMALRPLLSAFLAFSAASMLSVGSARAETAPCQLAGEWERDDKVQRIELYQVDAQWFGRIVSSSEKNVQAGFVMLRSFSYDAKAGQFKGTVVVPTSGMQASGDLACTGDAQIKVTGHKLFLSKSHTFTRTAR
jgi:hypothetical protein